MMIVKMGCWGIKSAEITTEALPIAPQQEVCSHKSGIASKFIGKNPGGGLCVRHLNEAAHFTIMIGGDEIVR